MLRLLPHCAGGRIARPPIHLLALAVDEIALPFLPFRRYKKWQQEKDWISYPCCRGIYDSSSRGVLFFVPYALATATQPWSIRFSAQRSMSSTTLAKSCAFSIVMPSAPLSR